MKDEQRTFDQTFADSVDKIRSAYKSLGHDRNELGWTFLTCPRSMWSLTTKIAFISLNPGGSKKDAGALPSIEEGNAYIVQDWCTGRPGEARLQLQVRRLFSTLNHRIAPASLAQTTDSDDLLRNHVMSAQFIPFRSSSYKELWNRVNTLEFARDLWCHIFKVWTPALVVTIDRVSFRTIQSIFRETRERRALYSGCTGWGSVGCEVETWNILEGEKSVTIARLPHLSTYQLFPARLEALKPFFDALVLQTAGRL